MRQSNTKGLEGVPFLEKIPIIRELTSVVSKTNSRNALFIFLSPTILKDDKFAELRFISESDLKKAKLPGYFPASDPMSMKEACLPSGM